MYFKCLVYFSVLAPYIESYVNCFWLKNQYVVYYVVHYDSIKHYVQCNRRDSTDINT